MSTTNTQRALTTRRYLQQKGRKNQLPFDAGVARQIKSNYYPLLAIEEQGGKQENTKGCDGTLKQLTGRSINEIKQEV